MENAIFAQNPWFESFFLLFAYLVYDCFKNFDAANVRSFDGTSCIWSWFWFDLILILVLIWFWFDIILILIWFWFDFDLILIWFWFAMRAVFFGERADFGVAGRAEISPPVPVPPPLKMLILHHRLKGIEHTFFWRVKIHQFSWKIYEFSWNFRRKKFFIFRAQSCPWRFWKMFSFLELKKGRRSGNFAEIWWPRQVAQNNVRFWNGGPPFH